MQSKENFRNDTDLFCRSRDSPDDGGGGECPRLMYQSVALSVLSCFTADFEIMTDASVIFNIPVRKDNTCQQR